MIKWILLIFLMAPTPAISDEIDNICVCKNDDFITVVQNVGEEQYEQLQKFENDLLCTLLETNRVDNRFRLDILVCSRDENT